MVKTDSEIPSWVLTLGIPVWISGPDSRIIYANRHARRLFEPPWLGRPCHEVVCGRVADGRKFCGPACRLRRTVREGREIRPLTLRIADRDGLDHWFHVLALPWTRTVTRAPEREPVGANVGPGSPESSAPQGLPESVRSPRDEGFSEPDPALVHCALPWDREHRVYEYLERLASRSHPEQKALAETLTPREQEVLDHLSRDETLYEIADSLHVSYTTVRNHVQHILAKLEAHSVSEAVARRLLEGDE